MTQVLFSWIHLADLHFGHGDASYRKNQRLVLDELKHDLARVREIGVPAPDAIFVTGDVAFSGGGRSPEEYLDAKQWLDAVTATVKLKPNNVFIVPGNHDVNRAKDRNRVFRSLLADLRWGQGIEDRLDTALDTASDKKLLTERMEGFLEFAAAYGPWCNRNPLPPVHERLFWRETIPARGGLRVRLVGLNTALLAADDQDERKLQLGNEQLQFALDEAPKPGELVVILTHHPLQPWLSDGKEADQWIRSRAHVHIFGHVHEADLESIKSESSKAFIRMIAGAAHGEREARDVPARHGYNVAAVVQNDDGSLELRFWPRRWADRHKKFRVDMDLLDDREESIAHPLATVLPTPEVTPVMSNMTVPWNSEWRTGQQPPIWRGGSLLQSRLRFELPDSGGTVDLLLQTPRKYHLGRTPLRADGTPNDCVLLSPRVSADAASVELMEGCWSIQNTAKTSKLLVNGTKVPFGARHSLVHGCMVVIGDVVGEFRDGRYYPATPPRFIDSHTGLLSAEGLACEVSLALAAHKSHVLLAFHFDSDDIQFACMAARMLHEADPMAPIGRIETTVAMLINDTSRIAHNLKLLRADGLSVRAAGYWKLNGASRDAGALIDAVLGALRRIVVAGWTGNLVDLAAEEHLNRVRHLPEDFPAAFAVEWGHDEFGLYMSFAVGDVVQRMRWIPAGTFMMGSSETEVGREDDEMQHPVELIRGLWLADTPVTQALWEVVMGENPSKFKDANRPVESVSWKDCQSFIQRLNNVVEGLEARLPTEAEWEYACRAGTTKATWVGNLERGQEKEAPLLESIAWYWKNSGESTHPVAQKAPNPWGLYDMLGNVWEWCTDLYYPHGATLPQNLKGPWDIYAVVLRGGSWVNNARDLRAARRLARKPGYRYDDFGLRLALGPMPIRR